MASSNCLVRRHSLRMRNGVVPTADFFFDVRSTGSLVRPQRGMEGQPLY